MYASRHFRGKSKKNSAAVFLLTLAFCRFGAYGTVVDDCQYRDDSAARQSWRAIGGTSPVRLAEVAGRRVLVLPCNFATAPIERAVWDRAVQLDLSEWDGIELDIACRNATPIAHFTIYFQSGEGWYAAPFSISSTSEWNRIFISKADTEMEGRPGGWKAIRTIRLSAWRCGDENTEIGLAGFRAAKALVTDTRIAVVRAESLALDRTAEKRAVRTYTASLVSILTAAGISSTTVSDFASDLSALRKAELVILPYNPEISDPLLKALQEHIVRRGKLIAFYTLDARLSPYVGIARGKYVKADPPGLFAKMIFDRDALPGAPPSVSQRSWNIMQYTPVSKAGRVLAEWLDERARPTGYAAVVGSTNCIVISHILLTDDLFKKRQMLRAIAGALVPDLWRTAALSLFGSAASIGPYRDFDSAVSALGKIRADVAEVRKRLDSASRAREMARKELIAGSFRESCAKSDEAAQLLLEAYCLAQRPLAGEFRGFWCHSAFGVEGMSWETVAAELKRNGFTAVLPNMSWGGVAYYRSRILPNAPEVASRGDQLAECLTACRRYGIQVHLWKVNWNLGPAPQDFVAKLRREHRLQTDVRGREQLWLCPSHPENQQLEIEAMLEVVRNYELDGIHFDYIRYPNENHCFCEGCRNRFQKASGCRIAVWPRDVLPGGIHREAWLDWRRANITALVRAVSTQARAIKPRIKISAAVFPNWNKARDIVGQDWRRWCEQAYLDFVCPMNYTGSATEFENLVRQQKQCLGAAFLYPGVGASAVNPTLPPDKVVEQILVTRKYNTGGFVVFNLDALQIRETLPLLGLGITKAR